MRVYEAPREEIPALVVMAEAMHGEGDFAHLPFNTDKLAHNALGWLKNPDYLILSASSNDEIIGMFVGHLTRYIFADAKMAHDIALYVKPEKRGSSAAVRLIDAYRLWAMGAGASEVCIGQATNVDTEKSRRFFERMGFHHVGGNFKERL